MRAVHVTNGVFGLRIRIGARRLPGVDRARMFLSGLLECETRAGIGDVMQRRATRCARAVCLGTSLTRRGAERYIPGVSGCRSRGEISCHWT